MENQIISWKPTEEYLGTRFNKRLAWNQHTHQIGDKLEQTQPKSILTYAEKVNSTPRTTYTKHSSYQ